MDTEDLSSHMWAKVKVSRYYEAFSELKLQTLIKKDEAFRHLYFFSV